MKGFYTLDTSLRWYGGRGRCIITFAGLISEVENQVFFAALLSFIAKK